MRKFGKILFFCLCFLLVPTTSEAKVALSPQSALSRALEQGHAARITRLQAESANLGVGQAKGVFDWQLVAGYAFEQDRAETFTVFTADKTEQTLWNLGVSKKLPYGTAVDVSLSRLKYDTELSAFSLAAGNEPVLYQDVLTLGLRQNILGNPIGLVDRLAVQAAEHSVAAARLERDESLESIGLRVLTRYWQAFAAQETIAVTRAARKKYEDLIKTLERKQKLGVASRADIEKARAEFTLQDRNVTTAELNFANLQDALVAELDYPAGSSISFVAKLEVPALPVMQGPMDMESRAVNAQKEKLERAELERRAARWQNWPTLDLVGSYGVTGVEPNGSDAFQDMRNGGHPTWEVGLELVWPFASERVRAQQAYREVQYLQAETSLALQRNTTRDDRQRARRDVLRKFAIAQSAIREAQLRQDVVREQERSFRQGRIDFSQLIIDYNALYRSEQSRLQAVAEYRVSLAAYAAATDDLIPLQRQEN